MGLINEKEDPELILKKLIQNQNKIPQYYNQNSYKLIHKILNYYQFFDSLLHKGKKNEKNNSIQNNTIINNIPFKYKIDINKESNKINHQIDRIKKWINMLRTKNTLKRFSNERYSDSMEKNSLNFKKYLSEDFTKKTFFHSQSINPIQSSNVSILHKLNHKSLNKQVNQEEMNLKINIFEYTDLNIEKGIKNFYIKHTEKFIERIIKGPPDCFRVTSWLILNKIPLCKNEKIYNYYLQNELNENIKKSIIKDIQRSFFHIKKEENEQTNNLRPKERKLYNVLKAFSNLDKDLGYCQGMNIITSFLLNVFDFNEIEVFYLLISMFSSTYFERNVKKNNLSIRGFFSDGFPLLLFMNYIFDFEFNKLLPDLKKKFDELSITYDMWIGKWFQTLFIIVLPFEMCKRLFDCIFVYGIFFLIQFGLALIINLEKNLIKLNDEIEISNYFKKICENIMKNNNSYFQEIMNINELINKSEKIKIDYNDYFNKYVEENPSFKDEIEKDNIEYELYDHNNDFENTNDSNFKRQETILFSDDENNKNYKIKEFNLLDNNKSNNYFKIHKKKSKHIENYDDDIEENISIDFGQLSESKKYKYSIIMNSISVLNNQEFSYDDNNNTINADNNRYKKLKAFYKMSTIDPNFIKHIDLKEDKKKLKK